MGETRASKDVRLSDAEWRTSGDKRILNEGPLWPRKETMSDPQNSQNAQGTDDPQQPPRTPGAATTPAVQSGATTVAEAASGREGEPLTQAAAPAPIDDRIAIEDFMKVELRTARIIEAERVPKSKKLMKMRVDVGTEQRTIVAGIADAYEPEALVGKTVVIVANLKPAKLMGIESNGMVLAASPDGGAPIVLNAEPAEPGTRVR
jgi:methionyl-tRNA synthetase